MEPLQPPKLSQITRLALCRYELWGTFTGENSGQALAAQRLLDAIYESARGGREVMLSHA